MNTERNVRRFVRYHLPTGEGWGVLSSEDVVHAVEGSPLDGEPKLDTVVGSLTDLSLLPPVAPSKIICVGRNYKAHAAEYGVAVPEEPLLFLKPPSALTAHGEAIVLPPQSAQVEHEGELGVVIGRRARHVSEGDAWQHVLGLTCANDVTARDLQRKDSQWTRGKGFDSFCPVGPFLVTGISEAEAGELQVWCRVNGELKQDGNTRQMAFTPSFLIAYVSSIMTLEPGDLILTGTPSGVSPLKAGDVVEVEVSGLGTLRNPVRA